MIEKFKSDVRNYIFELGQDKLKKLNISQEKVSEEFDLIDSGFVNSMSFLELLMKIEERFKIEIDFDGFDPSEFTSLGGFLEVIAKSKLADTLLPTERESVVYSLMTEQDISDVVDCFSNFFRKEEPLTRAMAFSEEEFLPVVTSTCKKAARDGLSIVAREKTSQCLLGFSIGKDYRDCTFDEEFEFSPKFNPIFELHGEMDEVYKKMHSLKSGEVYLHHALGIDLQYFEDHLGEKQACVNIVPELSKLTYELARKRNFKKIIGHATSLFTQRLYKKYDFSEVFRVNYKTFSYKDDDVFRNIKWHSGCVLFERILP